ncbi:sigma-70 family RNA polymerase sigma factor [Azotobacter chroococcum]|nr:sigma-70 family RNA polymerase sigma factor [Azotobacter chroococcum]
MRRLHARLGCAHDAADIASETFTQVVALEDPGAIREPRALLTTIAKRLVYRDLERAYLEALAQQPEAVQPSAEETVLVLEALTAIDQLLDGLSPKARAAFLYSQLEGLTYAEIATRLGVSVTRVHQYVVKGLTTCYLALEPA